MTITFKRRSLLMSTLFGAGYLGLRALATGVPVGILMGGRKALADGASACIDKTKAQYFVMSTSYLGDPINANVPGSYDIGAITHSTDPTMAATKFAFGGGTTTAALPWSQLPTNILQRTTFWHIMSNTPVHPAEPNVLTLLNTTQSNEMLPSLLAKQMAPCLNTIQSQPITVGATNPTEALKFEGQALPIIPPLALKSTLTNPTTGPLLGLTNLQAIRDNTLGQLSDLYRTSATKAQKAYLDSLILSQSEIRGINQSLLDMLSSITDNSVASQITAAIALIKMNVTPVVAIHIPFGGDNHNDTVLATETTQTVAGVASIEALIQSIDTNNMTDQVSFMSLNVFGRTLGPSNTDGRQHNPNHQVSVTIGTQFKSGIVGGIQAVGSDYGCMSINSSSGAGVASGGDIATTDTLSSFGKTMLASVGVDDTTIDTLISGGKVISGALA
ncbi:MAG TPA: hypothetical protein VH143_26725 [Kofleriaceae bacterium]|jgi:hypothetical protein|nr:hypothetical protein [Kofleriaceae bacterium]